MHLQDNSLLQVGKYKVVRFISAGGFGCTYEAEHVMLHKKIAIKEFFVKDFCNRDEQTSQVTVGTQTKVALVSKLKKKFIEEAVALSGFNHPNIVSVSDVFEENGTAYYVMDYIDGESVHDILKTENLLSEERSVKYTTQIAHALQYVHAHNRLHLDIKPGNIMVDCNDNAILIDFGTSKQYDEEAGENTSTLLGKTPGYAPIEQLGNSVRTFTPATDIYSLGATLYKMLTGITPPEANILVAEDDELKPLPVYVSAATRSTVKKAMQVKRKDRPQCIEEFLDLIENKGTKYCLEKSVDNVEDTIIDKALQEIDSSKEVQAYDSNNEGHSFVDLGLSVNWSQCNVGATKPEEYGDYFAWGEIEKKSEYTLQNAKLHGKHLDSIAGNPIYDVATAKGGVKNRIPTSEEIQELIKNSIIKRTEREGVKGCLVTSRKNGKSIFFPASGFYHGTSVEKIGKECCYWSASPCLGGDYLAQYCYLGNDYFDCLFVNRFFGLSIRSVQDK